MRSGQLSSVLSAISWLVSLSVISLCIWIVSRGFRRNTKHDAARGSLTPPVTLPMIRPRGEITIWIGSMLMMLAIGLAIGYGTRDHELVTNTRTYFGVTVLSQQSDRSYTVRIPGFAKDYPWDFCHPLKMPAHVIDIKYEQRFGCKIVNGTGFVQPHEEKKNELQTRRYNSTTTEPTAGTGLEARR